MKIHQSFYANKVLEKFNHTNCSSVYIPADPGIKLVAANSKANEKFYPYREAIGSLMYLAVCTRPDLAYIVGVQSRYMENPDTTHWQGIKRVFKYLKGSIDRGITYKINSQDATFSMYCDSDWGGDNDTRKSTSGWIGFINGGPVTWTSRKQTVIATSTTDAEFVALCSATKMVMCTRKLLQEIGETQEAATSMYWPFLL